MGEWKAKTAKQSISIRSNRAIGNGFESEEANFGSNGGENGEFFNDFIDKNVQNMQNRNLVIRAKLYGNIKNHSRPIYSRKEETKQNQQRNQSRSEKTIMKPKPELNYKSEIKIPTRGPRRLKRDLLESLDHSRVSDKQRTNYENQLELVSMRPVHNCEFVESKKEILCESGVETQKGNIDFLIEKKEEMEVEKKGESVVTEFSMFENASVKKSILLKTLELKSEIIRMEKNSVLLNSGELKSEIIKMEKNEEQKKSEKMEEELFIKKEKEEEKEKEETEKTSQVL